MVIIGSSPRVRGKRRTRRRWRCPRRIIPASAGQTGASRRRVDTTTDHPRECGANVQPSGSAFFIAGSSPRVRGKLLFVTPEVKAARIIPASAGQTMFALNPSSVDADHPRECGANSVPEMVRSPNSGSSPRVRGKQLVHVHRVRGDLDHPRECGANSPALLTNHTLRMPEKFNLHTRYEYHRNLLETTLPDPPHRCTNHNSSVVLSISYLE